MKTKRAFTFLLALCMAVSLLHVGVLAEETMPTGWESLRELLRDTEGTVTLTQDYTATADDSYLEVPEGRTVTLDLNGHTVDGSALSELFVDGSALSDFTLYVRGTLILMDSQGSGKLVGSNNGAIYVGDGGSFTVTGGTITADKTAYGAVYVGGNVEAPSSFTVSGAPRISSVYLASGAVITIGGELKWTEPLPVKTEVTPTAEAHVTITSGLGGVGRDEQFASADPDYAVYTNAVGEAALRPSLTARTDGTIIVGNNDPVTLGKTYAFIPEDDGEYVFYSVGEMNTMGTLYLGDNVIPNDDNSGEGNNFRISAFLYAGLGYKLCVSGNNNGDCTVVVEYRAVQTISFASETQTKTYGDADFTVTVTGAETSVSYQVTAGDAATVNSDTGAVHIVKAGTATITATAAESDDYLSATASYTLTVVPKTVTIPTAATGLKWTGNEQTGVATGEGYSVANGAATAVDSYTATATLTSTVNYKWSDGTTGTQSIPWSIGKATAPSISNVTLNKVAGTTSITASVAGKMPVDAGTLSYSKGGAESVTGGKGSSVSEWSVVSSTGAVSASVVTVAGDTITLPVTISSTNYEDSTVNVVITLIDLANPVYTAPTANTLTYNGGAQALVSAGVVTTGGTMRYSLDGTSWSDSVPTGKNAGSYTVYYKIDATTEVNGVDSTPVNVTIARKDATVKADDKSKVVGATDPALTATVTGLVGSDQAGVLTFNLECKHDEAAGTYQITVSGDALQGNYAVSYAPGTFTISATPIKYTVTVTSGTGGGSYASGETVTITANAAPSGQTFDKWTTSDGVTFANASSANTTFTMPAKAVTVTATYKTSFSGGGSSYDDDDDDSGNSGNTNSTAPAVTVPVTDSDTETLHLEVTVSGAAVTADAMTDSQFKEIAASDAPVVFDLSALGEDVTTVNLPAETFAALAEALEQRADGADKTVTFETALGSVSFDAAAVQAIAAGAVNGTVTLNFAQTGVDELRPAQQAAFEGKHALTTYSLSLLAGGATVSSFGDGGVTLELPLTLAPGTEGRFCAFYFVADDGKTERMPTRFENGKLFVGLRHFSDYVLVYEPRPFADVAEGAWYYDAVYDCYDRGIMEGVSDDTFDPDGEMSRAMVVTMLWRLAGEPAADGALTFTDVPAGEWYTEAVRWTFGAGVVDGYEDNTFRPSDSVTREQLAAILYRYAQTKGEGFKGMWYFLLDYPDAADVSDWADEAMHWMVMHEIITGTTDADGETVLDPQGTATRAQVAAIMTRFVRNVK
ncbi:MAG: hypothetical protein E7472_04830 [Ruminococcaceae bacterium]|nr:hypothetical protein [Oscillospiraceae bacterium]